PIHNFKRGKVEKALRDFLQKGKRSVVSDLAVELLRDGTGHSASDVPASYAAKYAKVPPEVEAMEAQRFARPSEAPEAPPAEAAPAGPPPLAPEAEPTRAQYAAEFAGMPDDQLEMFVKLLEPEVVDRVEGYVRPEHADEMLELARAEQARRQASPE